MTQAITQADIEAANTKVYVMVVAKTEVGTRPRSQVVSVGLKLVD